MLFAAARRAGDEAADRFRRGRRRGRADPRRARQRQEPVAAVRCRGRHYPARPDGRALPGAQRTPHFSVFLPDCSRVCDTDASTTQTRATCPARVVQQAKQLIKKKRFISALAAAPKLTLDQAVALWPYTCESPLYGTAGRRCSRRRLCARRTRVSFTVARSCAIGTGAIRGFSGPQPEPPAPTGSLRLRWGLGPAPAPPGPSHLPSRVLPPLPSAASPAGPALAARVGASHWRLPQAA